MKLQVVVGGQFGSEAKGHVAGWLAQQDDTRTAAYPSRRLIAIRVAGPNAGHSVVCPKTGNKYALRQIPVAAVTNPTAQIAIAAGSEIDPDVFNREMERLDRAGYGITGRLWVDPQATLLTSEHISSEIMRGLTPAYGSTAKGIGAARAARIMREAKTVGNDPSALQVPPEAIRGVAGQVTRDDWVMVEGTQGYGLGLHAGHYPYCTSSDCAAIDFLSMAQINPWMLGTTLEIWVVFRPYPIRVAGNSGPLYHETTWETLGLEPEYTTVTQKMRRVGHWDPYLAAMAVQANGGVTAPIRIALTMLDQIDRDLVGCTDAEAILASDAFRRMKERVVEATGLPISLVTTSDRTAVDLRGRDR